MPQISTLPLGCPTPAVTPADRAQAAAYLDARLAGSLAGPARETALADVAAVLAWQRHALRRRSAPVPGARPALTFHPERYP